jgi:hypothetical protein
MVATESLKLPSVRFRGLTLTDMAYIGPIWLGLAKPVEAGLSTDVVTYEKVTIRLYT